MNVGSEPIAPKKLVQYVTVYSDGEIPAWMPDDYQPQNRIEAIDHQWSDEKPLPGGTIDIDGRGWTIAEVHSYAPIDGSTEQFHIAVCTVNGEPATRTDWQGSTPILYVPIVDGEPARNPDGSSHFGLAEQPEYLPEGEKLWFKPLGDRPIAGYEKIVVVCG